MENDKIVDVGKYKIKLVLPNKTNLRDLANNIDAYDEKGQFLWNVADLLRTYSEQNGLKYFDEVFFEIQLLDNQNIFCIGFSNHCEIDLNTRSIVRILNNR